MKDQTTDGVSRRDLLRGSLGVALGLGCFTSIGLRGALREAQAAGKPLLTERELNQMIPITQNRQAYLGAIDFARRDLLGYLTANFYLTPQQIAEVRSIPRDDLMQLNALLDRARANNLRITVHIMSGGSAILSEPNAVYLRGRSSIQSRSIPPATEQQTIEKGDPGQLQGRGIMEKQKEPINPETPGKVFKVFVETSKGTPAGVPIPYP
jgi:hypothetical protein